MEVVKKLKMKLQIETDKRTLEKEFSNLFDLKTFIDSFFSSSDVVDRRSEKSTSGYAGPERRMRSSKTGKRYTKTFISHEMARTEEQSRNLELRRPKKSYSKMQFLIYSSIISIFISLILFTLLFKINDKVIREDLGYDNNIGGVTPEDRFARLASELIELKESLSSLDESQRSLTPRLDELARSMGRLEEKMALVAIDAEATDPVDLKSSPSSESSYHEVRAGETLFGIARKYDIAVEQLCKLNQIRPGAVIRPGQRILVTLGS